jgi:hypothetical protein
LFQARNFFRIRARRLDFSVRCEIILEAYMCGRFTQRQPAAKLKKEFGVE